MLTLLRLAVRCMCSVMVLSSTVVFVVEASVLCGYV